MPSVLVVENEVILALDLAETLESLGYEVLGPAATAEDACQLARESHPDLVLMDISLNGERDGIAAAREITAESKARVIFLTSECDFATRLRAAQIPASAWLAKPCPMDRMKTTLAEALVT